MPYTLFVETDPAGTPDNLGLAVVRITIDTDTGVAQQPVSWFESPFDEIPLRTPGTPENDDIIGIGMQQFWLLPIPFPTLYGLGQSGPQAFAHGELIVPPAPIGTEFQASIFLDPGDRDSSWARVFNSAGGGTDPDHLLGNTLTISVVPEPSTALLLLVGLRFLGHRHEAAAAETGMTNRMEDPLCDPQR